jgi:hypothetical protein
MKKMIHTNTFTGVRIVTLNTDIDRAVFENRTQRRISRPMLAAVTGCWKHTVTINVIIYVPSIIMTMSQSGRMRLAVHVTHKRGEKSET